MKCPICGQELTQSKKDPNYMLCYNCRKKFRVSQNSADTVGAQSGQPAAGTGTSQVRQATIRARQDYNDAYGSDTYEEERPSNAPIVVLGVAIVIVLGLIIYMLVL